MSDILFTDIILFLFTQGGSCHSLDKIQINTSLVDRQNQTEVETLL